MTTKTISFFILLVSGIFLAGCSSTNKDPLESFNRPVYSFNHGVDTVLYKPLASMYDAAVPNPIEQGVNNVFDNLGEIPIIINNILQFKIGHAIEDTWRLIFNSTIGIGGIFDPASHFGLKRNYEDLGLTFSYWGIKTPYFVIPFLGSSTISDAIALIFDYSFFMIYPYIGSKALRYGLVGLDFIRLRAELLPTDKLVEESFDPYVFVRDAYTQKRESLLNPQQENDVYVEDTGQKISPVLGR